MRAECIAFGAFSFVVAIGLWFIVNSERVATKQQQIVDDAHLQYVNTVVNTVNAREEVNHRNNP